MNKISEIKNIVCENDKIVIYQNNDIIYTNIEELDKSNADVKIFYIITDEEFNHTINFSGNSIITQIYYEISDNCKINFEYSILKNANVKIVNICKDGINLNTHTNLEENAYCKIDNLYITNNITNVNALYDIKSLYSNLEVNNVIIGLNKEINNFNLNVKHNTKNSTSKMITYAVSKNSTVVNVNTNGIIVKGASKTDLNQKTKGIILDEISQISANPILEIDEYDVIASHGASIGAIDDEELYYLMSRGLTKEASEKLIIGGLIYPFLEAIESENIKKYVGLVIDNSL